MVFFLSLEIGKFYSTVFKAKAGPAIDISVLEIFVLNENYVVGNTAFNDGSEISR